MSDPYFNPNAKVIPTGDFKLTGKKQDGANVPPSLSWEVTKGGFLSVVVWLSDPNDRDRAPLKYTFGRIELSKFWKDVAVVASAPPGNENQQRFGSYNKDRGQETFLIIGKDENGFWISVVAEHRPAKRKFYVVPPLHVKLKRPGSSGEALSYQESARVWYEPYFETLRDIYTRFLKRNGAPQVDDDSSGDKALPTPQSNHTPKSDDYDNDIPF